MPQRRWRITEPAGSTVWEGRSISFEGPWVIIRDWDPVDKRDVIVIATCAICVIVEVRE